MDDISIIGLDLAKRVFQAHGARADGSVGFRKKLGRSQVLGFFAKQPRCIVAMEACATAHEWGRAIGELGHEVRLIPPIYVKPFVKRQKNDAADAEAIAEAAGRPTMRFVAVKSEAQQAKAMAFRTRDLLVGQRTQLINALRGHLAEHGLIAPQGPAHVKVLKREAAREEETARLMTMPGVGPLTAMAVQTFAPPMETFRRGRDFAAWTGLVPVQRSTGGKQILGRTSKMGQRDIRRLLIIGAMSVVRWAVRKGAPEGSWLARMLARKPRMLVAIALANKMARGIWAMSTRGENFRGPVAAV